MYMYVYGCYFLVLDDSAIYCLDGLERSSSSLRFEDKKN